jgi:hypothetical protein
MNIQQINKMRDLTQWIKENFNKSANFEINFWSHTFQDDQTTEYQIWIEGVINKKSKCLDELVKSIPSIKMMCELNRELSA